MSGTITDLPVCVCRWCNAVYIIDERMYDEPERCPNCGRRPDDNTSDQQGEWCDENY